MSEPASDFPQPTAPPPLDDPLLVRSLRNYGSERVVFGRFRLLRELGAGGMAVVWLAFDERLQLNVALKFLSGMVTSDAEALHDLRREITRGLKLTHPGIVRLYDLHEDREEGLAAIAMEYIAGCTLAEAKGRAPNRCFDVSEPLVSWARELCDVLSYVHEKAKVVHRDLKPRNLMLAAEGELKVTDFGIAATLCESHSRLTQHPNSSGTPHYMSPQQAMAQPPTVADDIYALGATLYELLASKPPFFRGSMAVIINAGASQIPPSVEERRKELGILERPPIPPAWEQTIAACLAKEPADRPRSAREVAQRLGLAEPIVLEPPSTSVLGSTGAPERRRWPKTVLVAALVVAAGVALLVWIKVHPWDPKASSKQAPAVTPTPAPVSSQGRPFSPPKSSAHSQKNKKK